MRFAYADPPYLGQSVKHYGDHPEAAAYDDPATHRALIQWLISDYDGFALSLNVPSLRTIWPMCPDDVRLCAWVKPFAAFKKNVTLAYAWEPVIVRPLRKPSTDEPTVRDWVSAPITLRRGTHGAKPDAFSRWLFDFAGLERGDEFFDVFPGSGGIQKAFDAWEAQCPVAFLDERDQLREALSSCDSPLHIPEIHSPEHCPDRCGTCRSMAECSKCALLWPEFVAALRAALLSDSEGAGKA